MASIRDQIATYLQVAPFPHSSALFFGIAGSIAGAKAIKRFSQQRHFIGAGYAVIALLTLSVALFAEADARSRFQEYLRLRTVFSRWGWKLRIVEPVSYSRCQRDTALVAAVRSGYGAQIRQYFWDKGYRWYHIIPDAVLKRPGYVFTRQFMRSSFLVKTYKRRNRLQEPKSHRDSR
ncbi:MAG: hypothetical protein MI924_02055 [Chloroflexales bacterium]|nr:hypothetical protein [Chloroflexales bacterium]